METAAAGHLTHLIFPLKSSSNDLQSRLDVPPATPVLVNQSTFWMAMQLDYPSRIPVVPHSPWNTSQPMDPKSYLRISNRDHRVVVVVVVAVQVFWKYVSLDRMNCCLSVMRIVLYCGGTETLLCCYCG